MTRKERWQLLSFWFFLGLLPLFMRPLWEPDEARYAEIPREMLALGDWLTPRLNYVLYFEKPPLQVPGCRRRPCACSGFIRSRRGCRWPWPP